MTKEEIKDFLINKILNCDLIYAEWSDEDYKKFKEIEKELNINGNDSK